MPSRIPDLPGDAITPDHTQYLRQCVADMCQIKNLRFPGSQPVSFASRDLDRLENEDYWVCEKSDGVRVLLLVHTDGNDQSVYIIDRHNSYRQLVGFYFPHHEFPTRPLRNTIVDGELVLDVDPRTQQETLRMLAFDCLVVDNQNVMSRTLDKRYGRLKEFFHKPYAKMLQDHKHMAQSQPFDIRVKDMETAYRIDRVLNEIIPRLHHGNDGLIYTCVQSSYVVGTDPKILKWKPPSENSIDFRLSLRFPPDERDPSKPNYYAKPLFGLLVYRGGRGDVYEPFDEMYVDDDEWEQMKRSGEQFDDRIVEVHWDSEKQKWRMMRLRDDKPNGNHVDVVMNIISSIMDGVEKDDLLSRSASIRDSWKAREAHHQGSQAAAALASKANVGGGNGSGGGSLPPPSAAYPVRGKSEGREWNVNGSGGGGAGSVGGGGGPWVELKYGPLQVSSVSKVGGPEEIYGFIR